MWDIATWSAAVSALWGVAVAATWASPANPHPAPILYACSASAFATSVLVDGIAAVYDESIERRRLAALNALVKALSLHCDLLVLSGRTAVVDDAWGIPSVPLRYLQWMLTTPTMLFVLCRMVSMPGAQLRGLVAADAFVMATGLLATHGRNALVRAAAAVASFMAYPWVVWGISGVVDRAKLHAAPASARRLSVTQAFMVVAWSSFPVAWLAARTAPAVFGTYMEPMLVTCNAVTKLVFGSALVSCGYASYEARVLERHGAEELERRLAMIADLQHAAGSKDDLISLAGSELRTPVNALARFARVLRPRVRDDPVVADIVSSIEATSSRLSGVVNDILAEAAGRGGLRLATDAVDAVALAKDVCASAADASHVPISVGIEPGAVTEFRGDRARLRHALMNLVANAVKFTDRGDVRVHVCADDADVVFKVVDTGTGMTAEAAANAFVPFAPARVPRRGLGLGLSIVRHIAAAHGGRAWCENTEPGVGSTFAFAVPREPRPSACVGVPWAEVDEDGPSAAADASSHLPGVAAAYGSDLYGVQYVANPRRTRSEDTRLARLVRRSINRFRRVGGH